MNFIRKFKRAQGRTRTNTDEHGPAWGLVLLLVLMALLILPVLAPRPARAQSGTAGQVYTPNWYKSFTTNMAPNTTITLSPTNSLWQDTPIPGRSEALWLQVSPTNTLQITNVSASVDLTPDGTNWTTTTPFSAVLTTVNNTSQQMGYTNIPVGGTSASMSGVRKVALTKVINGSTNYVPVTLWFSHDNN